VLSAVLAVGATGDPRSRGLLVAAAVCLLAAGLITRFANQPINAIVMTWNAGSPAANWADLRDAWWRWHALRTVAGIAALSLTLLAVIVASDGRMPVSALPPT
jgi:uncharacterized membrane protein